MYFPVHPFVILSVELLSGSYSIEKAVFPFGNDGI